jgi:hypothetical protein
MMSLRAPGGREAISHCKQILDRILQLRAEKFTLPSVQDAFYT